ncbi:MAG: hypothetical protein P4L50_18805 [Anaerolineaceae bacterium]|nr:hypothetical protein [Anaerolineaceae bacterium]
MSDKKTRTYNSNVPALPTLQPVKPPRSHVIRREEDIPDEKDRSGQNNRMDQVMRLIEHFKTR